MSSRFGDACRRYAAKARDAWSMTTSARWPSTSASTQIDEIRRAWPGETWTFFTAAIASARARERLWSAAANSLTNSWSPRLKSASRSAMSTRWSGSDALDVDAQPEAVEQLRPQLALLGVDGADHAVLRGVDGELDHAHAALVGRQDAGGIEAAPAVGAQRLPVGGITAEMATLDHLVLGKEPGQCAHGGRLAGPLLAPDEDAADRRHDGVEDQRQLHRLLADDCCEGEAVAVELYAHPIKNRCAPLRSGPTP